jgi:hypothetical protein
MTGENRWIDVPGEVRADPRTEEVLRVWVGGAGQTFSARVEQWDDPAAWGLLLADLARHVARSYADNGTWTEEEAFGRVLAGLEAELND